MIGEAALCTAPPSVTFSGMAAMDERLALENAQVLNAVQASLGCISTAVRAIFVEPGPASVGLHFIVSQTYRAAPEDDLSDIAGELEALGHDVRVETLVEHAPRDWAERGWRCIYWAKGWSAWRDEG